MKMKGFYILGIIASVLVSCSSEENGDMPFSSDNNTLRVGTYIQQGTRASSKSTFVDGEKLGLYACQTTGDYANSYTANYMNNVVVTKKGEAWEYSPLSSWPTDENEHLSFIAFYPYSENSTALTYPFTLGVDAEGEQIDPLCCTVRNAHINDRNGTAINGSESDASFTATSGPLTLKFKHMLSKVKVKVKLNANYPGIEAKLNALSLNNVFTGGTYTVATDLASGTWGSFAEKDKKNISLKSDTTDPVIITMQETAFCDTLMIPQIISDTPAYLYLSYTHTLKEGGERTVTKNIYLSGSWEPNKIYNYVVNLSLDVDNITLSASIDEMEGTTDPVIGDTPAEAIDLGLSVKWASYDYGAMSPYEISPKFIFSDVRLANNREWVLTESEDRASKWGSNWSTPTTEQWKELLDNCTITEETKNGVSGYILISKKNGNSIFLGKSDYYWASNYYLSYSTYQYYCYNISNNTLGTTSSLNQTYSVRPVFK